MNKMNKKGFTLIEMLVVIAIIAVLVSIIVPVVGNSTTKAKAAADAANLRSIAASAAIDYLEDNDIDGTNFSLPTCETDSSWACKIYVANGEVTAFYGDHGVDYFADIAETGAAKNGVTYKSAPTGSGVITYPGAAKE